MSPGPLGPRSVMGARRVELRTSSLSATRSNQLSYAPLMEKNTQVTLRSIIVDFQPRLSNRHKSSLSRGPLLSYRYRLPSAGAMRVSHPGPAVAP